MPRVNTEKYHGSQTGLVKMSRNENNLFFADMTFYRRSYVAAGDGM
jgi:hypothetical protein